ncbi:MAG: VWA domain-containing protein [Myxococcales bacterium]|nr:VWA domain-containing protein [Myxococcales bacterium]
MRNPSLPVGLGSTRRHSSFVPALALSGLPFLVAATGCHSASKAPAAVDREASAASTSAPEAPTRPQDAKGTFAALEEAPAATAKHRAGPSGAKMRRFDSPGESSPRPLATAAMAPAASLAPMAPPPEAGGLLRGTRGRAEGDGVGVGPMRLRLDPNARYATTYRPGGAMLAAFDAAVARGSLPAAYRELVSDFGARYAPNMETPKGQALTFKVETERSAAAPGGGFMHLRVAMRSAEESSGRSPLSVHVVLDVSGSMDGVPIENAKKAAQKLVDRLEPTDVVSITTFSDSATVLVPAGTVGPRRGFITARINGITANGGTNISSGLDLGYSEARKAEATQTATKIVMLLSDGMANAGDTNPQSLAARGASALADGVQTSTFGVGDSFDAALMANVADRGAGGYYYLKDSSQISAALATELDARLQPVAQAVEVRVRLKPDVTPVRIYGSRELGADEAQNVRAQELVVDALAAKKSGIAQDRKDDAQGGMRFFMPAFARADRHAMLLELKLPPGVGERAIASVEIKYKDLLRKKNVTEEITVRTHYAGSDGDSAKTTNASVVATMQAFSAGDAILRASELATGGRRQEASVILRERAELLKRAQSSLNEPRLADDAMRLAKLASITAGETNSVEPVPLAILLRGSGYGYLR